MPVYVGGISGEKGLVLFHLRLELKPRGFVPVVLLKEGRLKFRPFRQEGPDLSGVAILGLCLLTVPGIHIGGNGFVNGLIELRQVVIILII